MKHLALMTTSYPDHTPGSEAAGSFVADFAAALSDHVRVTVVAPAREQSSQREGTLQVERYAVPLLPLSLLSIRNPGHWLSILHTMRAGNRALAQLAARETIDHIFALWILPSGYWARAVGRRRQIPYSLWALGSDVWSLAKVPVVGRVFQTVVRESAACFADGFLLQQDVEAITGTRCEFLPSTRLLPARPPKQLSSGPPYRLAFLGRWHPNKGADILLESLELLRDDDWAKIGEIRICGGGPLEEQVRNACAALQAAGRPVKLEGYLDKFAAAELLGWADYLIIPSRIESIPVVFSDAMQAGCPVISSPVGDLPRLFETWSVGVLAEAAAAEPIAAAIRKAVNTAPTTFAPHLQEATRAFDLKVIVSDFLKRTELVTAS